LISFSGFGNGAFPWGLISDDAGNLFGVASSGGAGNAGIVYELTQAAK
jgi:uncharacterized repeat protein (TIGR03803 family)